MPNKKISQLDVRSSPTLADLLAIADPSTGYAYKITGTNLQTLLEIPNKVPYTGATAAVNLGAYGLTSDYLQLSTAPTASGAIGRMLWNDQIGSTETTLKGGSVVLKNGVDLVARVVNKVTPAATLTKTTYKAVRVSGAQGQRLAIAYAQANNDNNSADTIGLVCETIAANQEGFIITVGQLTGINTTGSLQGETWADGDVLYLSPTTAGNLTNIKPNGSTGHIVVIGYVEYAHANNGSIYVKIMNGWELSELHDTYINAVANNDVLVYESSSSLWKNKSIATILGYTPADDSLVVHLAGAENITGVKTFQNAIKTTTGNNLLNTGGGNTVIGYTADPASSATYKLDVNGGVKMYGVHLIQSSVGGGNTFLTISNQAGTAIATLTNSGSLQFTGTATFTNTIGFNGKIGSSGTGGIAIVPGGVPSSLNESQIMLLVSAPLVDYTSTYGLNEQGIFLGGTYNGGQGPTRMILGPSRYYNAGGTATSQWNFTIQPASGQVTDGYGSNLILAGGQGRGTGTPGKFIVQTSTATTTGTTLQTLSNRLEVDGTGQLKLNGYTSTSVFTGTVAGLLGFDSSGNVITTSASGGGGISGSGTAGQVTYWSGTSAVTGSSNFVYNDTNGTLVLSKNQNASTLFTITNTTSGANSVAYANFVSTNGMALIGKRSATTTSYKIFGANDTFIFNDTAGDLGFQNDVAGGRIKFAAGTLSTSQMTLFSNGNLAINNGITDGGQRLQVIGSMRVGTTAASAMYWDDTNNRLGIGVTSPTTSLQVAGIIMSVSNSVNGALRMAPNNVAYNSSNQILDLYENFDLSNSAVGVIGITNTTWAAPSPSFAFVSTKNGTGTAKDMMFWAQTTPSTTNQAIVIKANTNQIGINGLTSPTALLDINASTTSRASLRIRSGTAPTSPNDGDIWYDGTNIYIRVGTTTKTFTII